jgi:hypothetical protein
VKIEEKMANNMIAGFSQQRVLEIVATKCTSNQRSDRLSVRSTDPHLVTDMWEDLVVPQMDEGKLAKVGMSWKVFHRM